MATRPAIELAALVRIAADDAGMSISEYIATVLAKAHGVPHLAPTVHTNSQEELPLRTA